MILPALFVGLVASAPLASATPGITPAPTFFVNATGAHDGAPTLGVSSSGAIFLQAGASTLRSLDAGASWARVDPLLAGDGALGRALAVDVVSDRVFVARLHAACSTLSFSDDLDAPTASPLDWVASPAACADGVGGEHQGLAVGPLPASPATPNVGEYGRALYHAWRDADSGAFMVARSPDGGLTWLAARSVAGGLVDADAAPAGVLHVAEATGYVYAEYPTSFDSRGVSVSKDGGETWTATEVTVRGAGHGAALDGGLGSDTEGNVYAAWWNDLDQKVYYAYSKDHGASWSAPVPVSVNLHEPAGGFDNGGVIRSAAYPSLVAGSDGRVAVAYFGTEDALAHPEECDVAGDAGTDCRWRLYLTTIRSADSPLPLIDTYAATDGATAAAKYAHVGSLAVGGERAVRAARDHAGWPLVAFADACVDAATCADDAGTDLATLAKAVGGLNLIVPADSPEPQPEVKIITPASGEAVPAGTVEVSGIVDREGGGANAAPTATLSATPTSGTAPLDVTFTLGASDSDGAVASWSLDADADGIPEGSGSGAPPASLEHAYASAGTYVAELRATDDDGATGYANVTVTVSAPGGNGIPQPDGTLQGSIFMYNEGGVGVSNVIAIATGAVLSDDVPKYLAGETVTMSSRSTVSTEPSVVIDADTPVVFHVYKSDGTHLAGPIATTGRAEDPTLSSCTPCYSYSTAQWTIPASASGDHLLVPIATVGGVEHVIGHKKVHFLGAGVAGGDAGPSDAGHSIGDADNDATTPLTEVQWVDAAVTPDALSVVIKLDTVSPVAVGDSPALYALVVNGLDLEAYVLGTGPSVWDTTNGQEADADTTWDAVNNEVRITVRRSYLADWATDCPCALYVEARLGEGQLGGLHVDDRAPDAGNVVLLTLPSPGNVVRSAALVRLGSASDPEVEDPAGDTNAPFMDVRKVWVQNEDASSFEIVMQVEDMSGQPPSVNAPASRVATNYGVELCLDNNLNSGATGPLFCYRLSAVNSLPAPSFSGGVIQQDGSGSCSLAGLVLGGAFNVAADTVTWRLDRAAFDVVQNGAAVGDCTTTPVVRGGNAVVDGTTLSFLEGSTGTSAGAVVIATIGTLGDSTDPFTARPYVFGGAVDPLAADAGGPYSGAAGAAIAVGGAATGGVEPYACAWTGGDFADASACATTVTFATAGTRTLTLTVTDADGATATDTATVTVTDAAERVEVYVDGEAEPRASAAVATSASSPTASWAVNVDLSGLNGARTLTARWVDADGTLLDTHAVTVNVGDGGGAFVTILSPADDPSGASPLAGTVTVRGEAGHEGGAAAAAAASPVRLRQSVVSGDVLRSCAGCADVADVAQSLGAAVAWAAHLPGGSADGVDGRWLDVAGRAGAAYALASGSDAALDVWFFASPRDAQADALGVNVGPDAEKAGIVPPGAAWAFVALRPGADGPATAYLTLTTQAAAPLAPRGLAAEALPHAVRLTWLPPAAESGDAVTAYRVYRDGALAGEVAATALAFTDVGLAAGASHTYRVAAVNSVGEGDATAAASAAALAADDTTAPTAPGAPDVAGATLTWAPASDDVGVDRYLVYRSTGATVAPATALLVAVTSGTSFTDAGLLDGATYRYAVAAVDAANNVGPLSGVALLETSAVARESVVVEIDGEHYVTRDVDTTQSDPAEWDVLLDTKTLADGSHTLTATYDDGNGGRAVASVVFHVGNVAGIAIDSPADGSEVASSFTASGSTTGTGGPDAPEGSSYVEPDGSLDANHPAVLVRDDPAFEALADALRAEPGFLALAPALDGTRVLHALFEGAAPADLHEELAPAGWTLNVEPNAEFETLRAAYDHVVAGAPPPRNGPPVPAQSEGIGPGSHILMTMPTGTFGCTANFVWKDADGNLYLGAAGHCFIPEGKTSTHGPGADYDPKLTRVRVCVTACTNGGQTGFIVTGTLAQLGEVVYSRQTGSGGAVGSDFGIVRIPDNLRDLVRPHMPVWNGPTSEANVALGDLVVHYGNAVAWGEVWPTMARAGIGSGSNDRRWLANTPSAFGDSGSAIQIGGVTGPDNAVEGVFAAGLLTHLNVNTGVVAGTTMARAKQMALEAGLVIDVVLQGADLITPPAAPKDVAAFAGDGEVTVTWTAPGSGGSAITGYTVKYGTSPGSHTESLEATDTSATVTGLTNGETYFFVVTATNAEGESPASAEVSATPAVADTPPGAPTVTGATAGDARVDLAWSAPADDGGSPVTGYTVKYGTAAGGPYDASLAASGTTAAVTGLVNGETYFFVVTATNAVGEGPASNEVAATPSDTAPPGAPAGLLAVAGDGEVTLYWGEPASGSDITGYTVKYGTSPGSHPQALATSATTLTVDGLVNGGAYYFVVSASNAYGEGPESEEASATPTATATHTYAVDVRVVDAAGADAVGWTPADAYDGSSWSHGVSGLEPGAYTLEARLLQDDATAAVAAVGVTVPNALPLVDAGADLAVEEGSVVSLAATAEDPDGTPLAFAWTQVSGPEVALTGADSATVGFTAPQLDADAVVVLEVTATDAHGGAASDRVAVTILDRDEVHAETIDGVVLADALDGPLRGVVDVAGSSHLAPGRAAANEPPTAVISDVVVSGMTVSASGALSDDADGSVVSHAWDLGNGDTASGESLAYEYAEEGDYTITLTVTDDDGAAAQASFGPFTVVRPVAAFVVDAGDSAFVKVGEPVALTATAYGADGAVAYAWDTDGDGVADAAGQSVQVDTTGRAPGRVTFTAFAVDASGRSASDAVNALLYETTLVTHEFANDVLVAVNDEDAGLSGTADGATFDHAVAVPAGTERLDAHLDWGVFFDVVPENPSGLAGGPNDFDLYVFAPDGSQADYDADFRRPEDASVASPPAGDWTVQVRSYVAVNDRYELTVKLLTAPESPLPAADQASEVCVDSSPQLLEAVVTGGAGVTGAWDLDLDGEFDDATGLTASTSFPLDDVARLVRFRATTEDGYRDTVLVAVRPSANCDGAPSVVVVAVADTGINPYHREFAGELIPYPELREFTTTDAAAPAPGDVVVRHAVTGELLPFTRHPSSYIPGFPRDAPAIELTLGGGFHKSADDASVWNRGHEVVPAARWAWIPGTKIVGVVDGTDDAAQNGAPDPTPLFDDNGHGTSASSVAVGNFLGTCPRCVLAFIEGLNTPGFAYDAPWVDFVSVSGSPRANAGVPDGGLLGFAEHTKMAAERGQTIAYAAGNGVENGFVTPEQTYLPDTSGPDWTVVVGAIQKGPNSVILGSGKPVDWSSFGSGNIPSACRNGYSNQCGFSGTSAATPISMGVMGEALLNARLALGDGRSGQKSAAEAGGKLQAVAVGDAVAASPWLEDGVLTRAELWNVAFHCASEFGTGVGFPGVAPRSPADFAYGGYGLADAAAAQCASAALVSGGPVRARPEADVFFEIDEAIRDRLWGDWDGDGDGDEGGNHNGDLLDDVPIPAGLTALDVDTVEEVVAVIRAAYDALGLAEDAPPAVETYYLHRAACADASDPIYMDRTPAAAEEPGHGCANVAANMQTAWASVVPTESAFPAGSLVSARVRAFSIAPHPALTMRGTLYADGVAVGTSTATIQVVSLALVTTPCHEWLIAFPTTADVPAGATLTFEATTEPGTGDVPTCYEGGADASRVTVTAVGEGNTSPGDEPTATVATPPQGAELKRADGAVAVAGTAEFPPTAVPQTLFLRRDDCANLATDRMYLSPVDAPDEGNGCAIVAGASAPVENLVESYALVNEELPIRLAPGAAVSGKVYFQTQGVDPFEVEIRVVSDAGLVGKTTASGVGVSALGSAPPVEVAFTFPVAGATAGVDLTSLALEVVIRQQGAIHWTELDEPASTVTLPRLAEGTDRVVQVAVDDPTFGSGLLAVTGTESWSASWSLEGVEDGPHTIYARAGQNGDFGPLTSVGVTVTSSTTTDPDPDPDPEQPERTPTIEVMVVHKGRPLDAVGWVPATTHDNETGAWSYIWDTAAGANGRFDFHVRLLADGVEVARDAFSATVANPKKPVFKPVPQQAASEDEAVSFQVEATDENGDPLTYTASGEPEGATFDPETRTFAWTPTYEQAGTYEVTFVVSDGALTDETTTTIVVADVNRAPVLEPVGAKTVTDSSTLRFTLAATDPDGDAVTFAADGLPAGASLDAATGAFEWSPEPGTSGNFSVVYSATDGALSDVENVTIRVVDVNNPPTLAAIGDKILDEGETVAFTVTATDPDGDPLTLRATNVPTGASWDAATGAFSWTTGYDDEGTYPDMRFEATDGEFTDSETIVISVFNTNRAPVIAPIGAQAAAEDADLALTVSATDPDGDAVTLVADALPEGATFDAATGAFAWRPGFEAAGEHAATFRAKDAGGLSVTETVAIVVSDTNRAPTASAAAPAFVRLGAEFALEATGTDADGDALTFAWSLGDGASATGASATHAYGTTGAFTVTLTVTDGKGGEATATRVVVSDALAPETTATVVGPSTDDGWFDETARVKLKGVDDASGVKLTKYALNSNAGYQTYSAPVALPAGEAEQTIRFLSEDKVGNVETEDSLTVKVDTFAPTVSLDLAHPADAVVTPTNLTAQAVDGGSGVARVEFLADNEVVCVDADASDGWSCRYAPGVAQSGRRALSAVAYDRLGHHATDTVQAVVVATPEDPTSPVRSSAACADRQDLTSAPGELEPCDPLGVTPGEAWLCVGHPDGVRAGSAMLGPESLVVDGVSPGWETDRVEGVAADLFPRDSLERALVHLVFDRAREVEMGTKCASVLA